MSPAKWLLASSLAWHLLIAAAGAGITSNFKPFLVEVVINNIHTGQAVPLVTDFSKYYLRDTDLRALNIQIPEGAAAARHLDYTFFDLGQIPSMRVFFDSDATILRLECDSACFRQVRLSAAGNRAAPAMNPENKISGAVVNYDAVFYAAEGQDPQLSGLLDAHVATPLDGMFYVSAVGAVGDRNRLTRLDTYWSMDKPEERLRLQLGDAVSRASEWSAPVRFAGLKYGTDFSLQPGFISFPTAVLQGDAALPSTVRLYINDLQRFEQDIPAGPFELNDLPVITGAGTARLVITDVLGRQQVLVDDFYASPRMLRKGLEDYAVEAGALRCDYSQDSFCYGDPFASFTWRKGMSRRFTLEAHGEASPDTGVIGGTAIVELRQLGTLSLSAAASAAKGGGALAQAVYDVMHRSWRVRILAAVASRDYRDLSYNADVGALSHRLRGQVGFTVAPGGNLSLVYTRDKMYGQQRFESIGGIYSHRLFGDVSLIASATQSFGQSSVRVFGLSLSLPLYAGAIASAQATFNDDAHYVSAAAMDAPQEVGDTGFRAEAGTGSLERLEGALMHKAKFADLELAATRVSGREALRATARGSIVAADGVIFFARNIHGGYAVVDVADQPGVRVYHDNRLVGRTDENGKLLVPSLRPYEHNKIAIEPRDLALNRAAEQFDTVVTTCRDGGVKVRFDAGKTWRRLRLMDGHGELLPAGSEIVVAGDEEPYFVGDKGLAHVALPNNDADLRVRYGHMTCKARVAVAARSLDAPPEVVRCQALAQ
jgi:outer membrane usher protein